MANGKGVIKWEKWSEHKHAFHGKVEGMTKEKGDRILNTSGNWEAGIPLKSHFFLYNHLHPTSSNHAPTFTCPFIYLYP